MVKVKFFLFRGRGGNAPYSFDVGLAWRRGVIFNPAVLSPEDEPIVHEDCCIVDVRAKRKDCFWELIPER